jgi:hypothetical protein
LKAQVLNLGYLSEILFLLFGMEEIILEFSKIVMERKGRIAELIRTFSFGAEENFDQPSLVLFATFKPLI